MSAGETIKKLREYKHLTQTDLAKRVGYADKSMIAKIEKGQIDLPQSKIFAFAKALDTTPSALMGLDGVSPNSMTITNPNEIQIIENYREASETTRKAINTLLNLENLNDKYKLPFQSTIRYKMYRFDTLICLNST